MEGGRSVRNSHLPVVALVVTVSRARRGRSGGAARSTGYRCRSWVRKWKRACLPRRTRLGGFRRRPTDYAARPGARALPGGGLRPGRRHATPVPHWYGRSAARSRLLSLPGRSGPRSVCPRGRAGPSPRRAADTPHVPQLSWCSERSRRRDHRDDVRRHANCLVDGRQDHHVDRSLPHSCHSRERRRIRQGPMSDSISAGIARECADASRRSPGSARHSDDALRETVATAAFFDPRVGSPFTMSLESAAAMAASLSLVACW